MKASFFLSILFLISAAYANEPVKFTKTILGENIVSKKVITLNNERFILSEEANQEMENVNSPQKKKSGIVGALFSAALPGAGEYYAESYWKSAIFAALEVIAWSSYFVYTDKADSKDTQMRNFGDENWSEQRYWTNIYNDALNDASWSGETGDFEGNLLTENFIASNKSSLREYERDHHTHTLPSTKTQQYYEMIYKYLAQFGVGWIELDELALGWDYYDNLDVELTEDVKRYRKLRNKSNGFYETATTLANVAMFNHLISALDAAWSVKDYNKKIEMSLMAVPKYYAGEQVATYGISISW